MNKKEYDKNRYQQNRNKISEQKKVYYQEHKEEILKRTKDYDKKHKKQKQQIDKIRYQNNRLKLLEQTKDYYKNNKEKYNKNTTNYQKNRRKIDINYKLKVYLRSRLRLALKGNAKKGKTLELLGCSIQQLRKHLEKQFKVDMTWSNYGLWHIDHIRPCASFNLQDPTEQARCFNYTNLQPLWAKDNLEKSDKILRKVKD